MVKYTFKSLARDVLADATEAMTADEIWETAVKSGMYEKVGTSGKTPQRSLQAQIYMDIKDNGDASDFVQVQRRPVRFALRANVGDVAPLEDDYTVADLIRDTLAQAGSPLTVDEVFERSETLGLHGRLSAVGGLRRNTLTTQLNALSRDEGSGVAKVSTRPPAFAMTQGAGDVDKVAETAATPKKQQRANERDLHPLLTTFVAADGRFKCRTRTIHHEESKKGKLGSDRWSYPDLVGVYYPFDDYEDGTVRLIETMRDNPYRVYSFEMKWKVDTSTVREQYFQAVSNSSWANEGYLVAPEISDDDDFVDDLGRLVNAFGIGVIRLDVENIEQSEVLFPARRRERLDWATVDRLVSHNADFRAFVEDINADAKTNGVRGRYDRPLAPDEYDGYVAGTTVSRLLRKRG